MIGSAFLSSIATLIQAVVQLYIFVIIAAALISWVRPDPHNQIVQVLYRLTEPVYEKIRRVIPTSIGGIDLAPLIVVLALQFLSEFLVRLLLAASL